MECNKFSQKAKRVHHGELGSQANVEQKYVTFPIESEFLEMV